MSTGPWPLLRSIEAYLAPPPGEPPPSAALISRMGDELRRPERRIIVVGAFKTGKSSLVNALLGAPVVPVRARQPSHRIAEIRFGAAPAAQVHRPDGTVSEVAFDAARSEILGGDPRDLVCIAVPAPLLRPGLVLVDSPGIGEDPAVTEAVLAAVARSDLAIMVLAADKILSAAERAAAAEITALLAGNVIYAVNRLDLVDEQDHSDVIEWARTALAGSGNALVGRPRVIGTAAHGPGGVEELQRWLTTTQESALLDRIAADSRLSRLHRLAEQVATDLAAVAAGKRDLAESAQQDHRARILRRQAERAAATDAAQRQLTGLLTGLGQEEERFVTGIVAGTAGRLEAQRGPVPLQVRAPMEAWVERVTEAVRDILVPLALEPPRFSLEDWIVRIQVQPPADTPDVIGEKVGEAVTRLFDGGKAGRATGAAIGSWIGKTVLGVDAEDERRKRIEGAARSLLPSLRAETERYLARTVVLLEEAERYEASREEPNAALAAAEEEAERATAHFHWAGTLVQAAAALQRQLAT